MTKLTKLHTDAFKNYSYKAKNWRTVMASNVPGHVRILTATNPVFHINLRN